MFQQLYSACPPVHLEIFAIFSRDDTLNDLPLSRLFGSGNNCPATINRWENYYARFGVIKLETAQSCMFTDQISTLTQFLTEGERALRLPLGMYINGSHAYVSLICKPAALSVTVYYPPNKSAWSHSMNLCVTISHTSWVRGVVSSIRGKYGLCVGDKRGVESCWEHSAET